MTRGHIISALILLGAIGIATSVYFFYFKEQLNIYGTDDKFKKDLEQTLKSFENDFKKTNTEQVKGAWTAKINPFNDALMVRARYFNFGKWSEHAPPPEDVGIVKYWYDTESKRLINELYLKVNQSMRGQYYLFPDATTLLASLGVHTLDDWTNQTITDETIIEELGKLSYGIKACELILEHSPTRVLAIQVWDEQQEGLVKTKRIGYSFSMTAEGLVNFIESIRQQDRYFSIDGMKITYPYILHPAEPQLEVEMLIAQAEYTGATSAAALAGPANVEDAYRDAFGSQRLRTMPAQKERSVFYKAWKWFNKVVLVRNI